MQLTHLEGAPEVQVLQRDLEVSMHGVPLGRLLLLLLLLPKPAAKEPANERAMGMRM